MNREEFKQDLQMTINYTLILCQQDFFSEDGSDIMLQILNNLPTSQNRKSFLNLCIKSGYPKETGLRIMEML